MFPKITAETIKQKVIWVVSLVPLDPISDCLNGSKSASGTVYVLSFLWIGTLLFNARTHVDPSLMIQQKHTIQPVNFYGG